MSPHLAVCRLKVPHVASFRHASLPVTSCRHLLPHVASYSLMLPHFESYRNMLLTLPHIVSRCLMPPHIASWRLMSPHAASCILMLPHVVSFRRPQMRHMHWHMPIWRRMYRPTCLHSQLRDIIYNQFMPEQNVQWHKRWEHCINNKQFVGIYRHGDTVRPRINGQLSNTWGDILPVLLTYNSEYISCDSRRRLIYSYWLGPVFRLDDLIMLR